MRKLFFLCAILGAVFLFSPVASAAPPSLAQGVRLAADHHLALEGLYPNGDLGSGFYDCAWQWDIGAGLPAYKNTQGPSGSGLLEAYEALGRVKYLIGDNPHNGAICAANQMIARYDADPAGRAYAQDLEFLVELSELTHNPLYRNKAALYHIRTRTTYPTGSALADHFINLRLSLSGWDLSAQILAAVELGQDDYAKAIALQLIARRGDWEGVLYGGFDYTLISHAALVGALDDMKGSVIKSYRKEVTNLVLSAQDTDGSWGGDFQTTAYALMGLETLSHSHDVRHAVRGGMGYLLSTQVPDGGWSYPPENGEVNGEVLSALAPLLRNRGGDDDCGQGFEGPKWHDRDGHGNARPHHGDDR